MPKKQTVRLPAITVEIPRVGVIVYVSPKTGTQDGKHTCMFTAEIIVKGHMELQSFHLKCSSEKEAQRHIEAFASRLAGGGPFPFIQNSMS